MEEISGWFYVTCALVFVVAFLLLLLWELLDECRSKATRIAALEDRLRDLRSIRTPKGPVS